MAKELAETIDRMLSELSDEIDRLRSIRYHVQDLKKGEMLLPHIDALDTEMYKTYKYGETALDEYGKKMAEQSA